MFLQSGIGGGGGGSSPISIVSLIAIGFLGLATAGVDDLKKAAAKETAGEETALEIKGSQKLDGIEAGSTPSLMCRLAVPGRVWWSSRGENLTTISDSEQQGRLDLKKASRNDTGNYTCFARTLDGRQLEKSVYVRVIEPGKVLGGEAVRAKVKTAVNLTCDIHGYPLSNFSWTKANDTENDYRLLERTVVRWMNETHAKMNLSFDSLSRKDNGTYACRAMDYNGQIAAYRHLLVTDVPQVSIDFIKAVGARRVFLNWTVNDGNEPIHSYFIKHMKNGTDRYYYGSELIGAGNTSYVLDGFESGTAYTFGISAENSVGKSHEQYDSRWVTTLDKDPIFVPNVSFNGNSETSINLRWQRPPADLKEHVHYYKLMAIGADQKREAIYLNTEFPSYAFTGLKPATTYIFKIAACSDYTKQCGNWSTEINATTLDGVASPPRNLSVICQFDDISGTSFASISWAPPERPNGEITRYDIEINGTAIFKNDMGRLDIDKWGPHKVPTLKNNTRIDKIPANTNYTVHVFGRTRLRAAAGQVAAGNCTTPVTIPDKESLNMRTWRKIENQGRQLFKLYLPRMSERNGRICCYRIYLVKLPAQKTIADLPSPEELDVYAYRYVHSSPLGGAYLAEMFDSDKLIPEIFLGDGDTFNDSTDCLRCLGLRPKAMYPSPPVLQFVPEIHPSAPPPTPAVTRSSSSPVVPTAMPTATPTTVTPTTTNSLPRASILTTSSTTGGKMTKSIMIPITTTTTAKTTTFATTTTTTTTTTTMTTTSTTIPTTATSTANDMATEAADSDEDGVSQNPQRSLAEGSSRKRRDGSSRPIRTETMSTSEVLSSESFSPYDGYLDEASNYTGFIEVIVYGEEKGQFLTAYSNYLSPLYGGVDPRNIAPERVTTLGIILQVAVALILIVLVLLIALCVLLRYTKRGEQGGEEIITLRNSFRHLCRSLRGRHQLVAASPPDMPPIPKNELLQAYLERHRDSDYGFQHEFELLPDRFADRTTRASEARENLYKNRYPDIKCYDQTRVRLTQLDGIFGSDYINANFVLGYKERKKFICAQGPMENTVCDYWRMIWEQHLELILMLTNLEEYSKTKCAKYWPDKEETKNFGDITVEHVRERAYSDYVVRELKMTRIGERDSRTIVQYHFLVWKDFMAPEHPHAILRFIKRVNEAYSLEKGPILVHCSAGVGRTGTLVALDSLLQQLAEEGQVSIFNTVCDLRHQRNFLVQSLKQYIFVYRALMEMAQYGDTEIAATQLKTAVERLRQRDNGKEKCRMEEEYDKINSVLEDRKSFSVGGAEENRSKNRSELVIPYDRNRVILTPVPGREHSTYINASFIEGYDNSESFVITQDPLESTIADFWRMISEQCISTIVMLSDLNDGPRKCPRYWPDDEASYEHIRIRYIQSESCPYFTRRELCVSNTKTDESVLVTQFQYHGWPTVEGEVPEVTRGLIELVDQTRQSNDAESTGSLVVHCSFGSDRSSMFVALSILVQQLRTEKRVDIFTTTKKLRSQRHGLISSFPQYEFLHRAIVNYSDLHSLAEDEQVS